MSQKSPWEEWGPKRWFRRGHLKYAILSSILEGPKHGYEIMKDLEHEHGGFYSPSPGSIYPTLQMLEDMGCVTTEIVDGKKVYSITDVGRELLESGTEESPWPRAWPMGFNPADIGNELRTFGHEAKELSMLLAHSANVARKDPSRLKEIRDVLSQTKKDIYRILSEQETREEHQ